MKRSSSPRRTIETLRHPADTRKNIPCAEHQSVLEEEQKQPKTLRYPRDTDLDPQLVWRGKDEQDWSDLVVHAPPLYIQEKVHQKVLIDDLLRHSALSARAGGEESAPEQFDLFADFNGIPEGVDKTEFYQHDQNWSNRMILGDSLQVMASLAEREGLRGQVQCIYLDPPYGIKFNSNFQWSTTSRDVKDGNVGHITREPEQVKAFRDTWRDGIHSYLTYLRDRFTVARDLLADSGSIFVQIGDENVHRVRAVMDEVFRDENCVAQISVKKTSGATSENLPGTTDFVLFYAKAMSRLKYRQAYIRRLLGSEGDATYTYYQDEVGQRHRLNAAELEGIISSDTANRVFRLQTLASQSLGRSKGEGAASWFPVTVHGKTVRPSMSSRWKTNEAGMARLYAAHRLALTGSSIAYVRFHGDFPVFPVTDLWVDTQSGSAMEKTYVVQTSQKIIDRCLLMTTDPGDLVLDPTCGSGTTAYVAEQWGRRWITIDTSRVALALARARIMGARYPFYLLADSRDGQLKEAAITRAAPSAQPVYGNIRHGFVYERVPHITLKAIANNAEIDVIWDRWQATLEPLRESLNQALRQQWEEWAVPRDADAEWPDAVKKLHADWWRARIARQREIDQSIAAKAESESLYDRPYEDKKKVRVAGPFTVESLSPHRVLGVDEDDELIDPLAVREDDPDSGPARSFERMILDNLKTAGVQQVQKEDRITFTALTGWPGDYICAEGRYLG